MEVIAKLFKPLWYFHPEETAFPCSVEYVLAHSSLYKSSKEYRKTDKDHFENVPIQDRPHIMVEATTPPTSTSTSTSTVSHDPHVFLRVHDSAFAGFTPNGPSGMSLADAPIYVRILPHVLRDPQTGRMYQDIMYHQFHAYNPATVGFGSWRTGEHHSDWEHVSLRFDITQPANIFLHSIYFSAHGDRDGVWRRVSDAQRTQRPVVYSALRSHANYPDGPRKTWWLACGCANDHTDRGFSWDPSIVFLTNDSPVWIRYMGNWAPNGVSGLPCKGYWDANPDTSNSWLRRICCCCFDWNCLFQSAPLGQLDRVECADLVLSSRASRTDVPMHTIGEYALDALAQ